MEQTEDPVVKFFQAQQLTDLIVYHRPGEGWPIRFRSDKSNPDMPDNFNDFISKILEETGLFFPSQIYCVHFTRNEDKIERSVVYRS